MNMKCFAWCLVYTKCSVTTVSPFCRRHHHHHHTDWNKKKSSVLHGDEWGEKGLTDPTAVLRPSSRLYLRLGCILVLGFHGLLC